MPPASADGKREAEEAWGGMHILVAMLIYEAVSAIPRESGAFLERPKWMGVKRRAKTERPEPALSERSEFQTRQRTKGTE